MAACDAHPEPLRIAEAWARLLHLEYQVRELRQLLQADGPPAGLDSASPGPAGFGPAGAGEAAFGLAGRLLPALAPLPSDLTTRPGASVVLRAAPGHEPLTAPTPAAHWHVVCLGGFRVHSAGRELLPCSSRRGWGILQYLLTRPGYAAPRDALIEAFWPESAPASGAHNLQMVVHALRRSLRGSGPGGSDEVVLYRDGQYALNPALTISLDVHRFRQACERGRQVAAAGHRDAARIAFEEAVRLYGGPFLHESSYDEWAEPHRIALQELQLGVLGWLSRAYAAQGHWEQAAAACREIVAADPYREDALRQLLRCLAATGRLAELERTYRACRERIWHDLQVEPAPETVRLYRELTQMSRTGRSPSTGTAARTGS